MLRRFASAKIHNRGSRRMSAGEPAGGASAAGARPAAHFQSGIHRRPKAPVTRKAARQPLRSAIQVATGGGEDPTVLRIGETELAHERRRDRGESGAVEIIDRGGEDEDRQHQPARARRVRSSRHWNSMVATSPVVPRRALLLAQYSILS